MNLERFKAPYITPEDSWKKADRIRSRYWPGNTLPIDVEEILWGVGLRLDPVASIKSAGDIDAWLTGDLTRIVVDLEEYMDDRMQNRMRFSIAHELGHFILHQNLYQKYSFESIKDWINFLQAIPHEQYIYLEQHAYEFAGRLLVPPDRLKKELATAIKKAEKAGFTAWEKSGNAAIEYIASSICPVFGVSSLVVEKRIIREQHKIFP